MSRIEALFFEVELAEYDVQRVVADLPGVAEPDELAALGRDTLCTIRW